MVLSTICDPGAAALMRLVDLVPAAVGASTDGQGHGSVRGGPVGVAELVGDLAVALPGQSQREGLVLPSLARHDA